MLSAWASLTTHTQALEGAAGRWHARMLAAKSVNTGSEPVHVSADIAEIRLIISWKDSGLSLASARLRVLKIMMRTLLVRQLCCVALAFSPCAALQLGTLGVARARRQLQRPSRADVLRLDASTTEIDLAAARANAASPLTEGAAEGKARAEALIREDSEFVQWYRYEKAKTEYEKENPVNPFASFAEKVKGAAVPIIIIFAGWNAIPIIKAVKPMLDEALPSAGVSMPSLPSMPSVELPSLPELPKAPWDTPGAGKELLKRATDAAVAGGD